MATIVLSAVGAWAGGSFGGAVLGMSGAVIGRAAGAVLGRAIDQRLMGLGSDAIETGRVDHFRLTGASEGAAIARVMGRMRVAGQVIWASPFEERSRTRSGGKGGGGARVTEYSYAVSLAVALCEGEITGIGRIWADGVELPRDEVVLRVYTGGPDQLPDPKIETVEGAGQTPAYRGTAYVVLEDLALEPFGNRVPQLSFEVMRPAQPVLAPDTGDLGHMARAVALMPGSGEYALATTPVYYQKGKGWKQAANLNSPGGRADLVVSLDNLREELPDCGSVLLIVSWFGDDLRCGACHVKPKVEQRDFDGAKMPWRVCGVARAGAETIAQLEGRPVYGGTPADASVIEAIQALRARGQKAVFYPFLLMEQLAGNGRADPWTGAADQPALPWRGRITLSVAPEQAGTPDGTAAAEAEVAAFFGRAAVADFTLSNGRVVYSGPNEWSYRRFILHYAHLAVLAGGVDAFCIGSEMRGLTRIRGVGNSFPAVAELRRLAADVRQILGSGVKISYAADWSEYFGHSDAAGNRWFHLDPLWADANIDFIGIDNYMPLSDWRDGWDHADAHWGAIYNPDYLKANILGGEGYEWYYASPQAREAQIRTPIQDGAHGEHWIWRYKDLRSWWENPHHERINGVRQGVPTAWVPCSKPIWFTELGCAAIDKGTNEPNRFLDPKSSESQLPYGSNGQRDDLIQMQYLRAMFGFWGEECNNPISPLYGGPMVDMARAHVWAWDARPYPYFPNNLALWSDGGNYACGHWIAGRTVAQPLAAVVAEICESAGVTEYDVSHLYGLVRGYHLRETGSARSALQPLMLAYGVEAIEREGRIVFRMRNAHAQAVLDPGRLVFSATMDGAVESLRAPEAELAGRVRLSFVEAEGDYQIRVAEAALPMAEALAVAHSDMPLALTQTEARHVVERWLVEARVARDAVRFALPPSEGALGAGDVVSLTLDGEAGAYRIDRVAQLGHLQMEAVRVEASAYRPGNAVEERVAPRAFMPPVPPFALFLDLPMMGGEETPHAPHLAVVSTPWPGSVALYSAGTDNGYELNRIMDHAAVMGETLTPLHRAAPGLWDRGPALRVRIYGGALDAAGIGEVLNGANLLAIGDGSPDRWEVLQFCAATLVGQETYDLSLRLRGQGGTDAIMPEVWPAGSFIVLLDGAVRQIELAGSARGLARHYRIGPASRGYDDPSYEHLVAAFAGVGLRPYAPCHLRVRREASGALHLSWVRRTRLDGDSWASVEVPLAEERESYLVRVAKAGAILREESVAAPAWSYTPTMQLADGAGESFVLQVAQVSERFGAGPFKEIGIND